MLVKRHFLVIAVSHSPEGWMGGGSPPIGCKKPPK